MKTDTFQLDLNLHHPDCDPELLTEDLLLQPWFCMKNGTKVGKVVHQNTTWLCHFREGKTEEDFDSALEDFLSLLDSHGNLFLKLIEQEGEIELVINSSTSIHRAGDKSFELTLFPKFLQKIGTYGVLLKLQVWSAE